MYFKYRDNILVIDHFHRDENKLILKDIVNEVVRDDFVKYNIYNDKLEDNEISYATEFLFSLLLDQYDLEEFYSYMHNSLMPRLKKKKRGDQ